MYLQYLFLVQRHCNIPIWLPKHQQSSSPHLQRLDFQWRYLFVHNSTTDGRIELISFASPQPLNLLPFASSDDLHTTIIRYDTAFTRQHSEIWTKWTPPLWKIISLELLGTRHWNLQQSTDKLKARLIGYSNSSVSKEFLPDSLIQIQLHFQRLKRHLLFAS